MSVAIEVRTPAGDILKPGLYFFKARWCHFCKLATPIIDQVRRDSRCGQYVNEISVGGEEEEIIITPQQRALGNKTFDELHRLFKVRGYPTIVMVSKKGKMTSYQGERTVEDIINAITQQDFFLH